MSEISQGDQGQEAAAHHGCEQGHLNVEGGELVTGDPFPDPRREL